MSDEDFVTGEGRIQLPNSDDVEEMLEILMKIAKSEGREFGISAGHGSHGSPQPAFSAEISLALAAQTSIFPDWNSLAGWLGASRAMLYLRVSNTQR